MTETNTREGERAPELDAVSALSVVENHPMAKHHDAAESGGIAVVDAPAKPAVPTTEVVETSDSTLR